MKDLERECQRVEELKREVCSRCIYPIAQIIAEYCILGIHTNHCSALCIKLCEYLLIVNPEVRVLQQLNPPPHTKQYISVHFDSKLKIGSMYLSVFKVLVAI